MYRSKVQTAKAVLKDTNYAKFVNFVYFSELWDQNDEEVPRPNFSSTRAPPPRQQFSSSANGAGDGPATADTFPFCLSSLSIAEERGGGEPGQERDEKRLRGRRAHFTIGKARDRVRRACSRAVLRIDEILVRIRIRIRVSIPLTNGFGSGSFFFVSDLQDGN
jgi:hypothetical protein